MKRQYKKIRNYHFHNTANININWVTQVNVTFINVQFGNDFDIGIYFYIIYMTQK